MKKLLLSLLGLSLCAALFAEVEIYNYPPQLQASKRYEVSVEGMQTLVIPVNPGGNKICAPFPEMKVARADEPEAAIFGAGGPVEVKVKFLGKTPGRIEVRPLGKNYSFRRKGNEITLSLKPFDRVSVEADGNIDAPLFIFVNPLEAEALSVAKADPDTKVYTAGRIYRENCFSLLKSKKIYIQGGAVLDGFFLQKAATDGAEISGCGILDARDWDKNTAFDVHNAKNLKISNITVFNQKLWSFRLVKCHDFSVDNVKVVAPCPYNDNWDENDGIHPVACTHGRITRCFAYSWDDSYDVTATFYDYSGEVFDIVLDDCIAWNVHPGNSFEVSWGHKHDVHDVHFKNLYAIHSGTKRTYMRAGIAMHHGGPASVYNISWENIWVEDPHEYGIAITNLKNGQLHDVTLKDIHMLKAAPNGCLVWGSDKNHRVHDITFRNLTIEGRKIKSMDDELFRSRARKSENFYNIKFK